MVGKLDGGIRRPVDMIVGALAYIVLSAAEMSGTSAVGTSTSVWVKDSAITAKIKTKLAADHLTSLGRIHVDTDQNGLVWLTGTARSQEAIAQAVSLARNTEHVKSVRNDLTVRLDV